MNPILMRTNMERVPGILDTIKYSADPMKMLSSNPKMAEVMQMVRGKNPEEVFYKKCEEMGVDPNLILGMLR